MTVSELLGQAQFDRPRGKISPHFHGEDLERFALDKVDDQERTKITAHIRDCDSCREQVDDARWFASRLKNI